MRTHILLPIVAAAIGTVIYFAVAVVIVASARHQLVLNGSLLETFGGVAVYNAVLNPLLYGLSLAFDRKLHPVSRANW